MQRRVKEVMTNGTESKTPRQLFPQLTGHGQGTQRGNFNQRHCKVNYRTMQQERRA